MGVLLTLPRVHQSTEIHCKHTSPTAAVGPLPIENLTITRQLMDNGSSSTVVESIGKRNIKPKVLKKRQLIATVSPSYKNICPRHIKITVKWSESIAFNVCFTRSTKMVEMLHIAFQKGEEIKLTFDWLELQRAILVYRQHLPKWELCVGQSHAHHDDKDLSSTPLINICVTSKTAINRHNSDLPENFLLQGQIL